MRELLCLVLACFILYQCAEVREIKKDLRFCRQGYDDASQKRLLKSCYNKLNSCQKDFQEAERLFERSQYGYRSEPNELRQSSP